MYVITFFLLRPELILNIEIMICEQYKKENIVACSARQALKQGDRCPNWDPTWTGWRRKNCPDFGIYSIHLFLKTDKIEIELSRFIDKINRTNLPKVFEILIAETLISFVSTCEVIFKRYIKLKVYCVFNAIIINFLTIYWNKT